MTVPFSVVGGYLGAGKTTLLNHLLELASGRRMAVVVNDFGSVGIDAALVDRGDGRTFELPGGCVCCQPVGGIDAAMREVKALAPPAEAVVVEISGVGLPGAVMPWGDHPGLHRGAALVCVDATTVLTRVDDRWVGELVRAQLAQGSHHLVTKADLAGPDEVARVVALLHEVREAPQVTTDRTQAARWLLDGIGAPAAASHGGHVQPHLTETLRVFRAVDPDLVRRHLERLPAAARIKGLLPTVSGQRLLVEVVGERRTAREIAPDAVRRADCSITVIVDPAQELSDVTARVERWLASVATDAPAGSAASNGLP